MGSQPEGKVAIYYDGHCKLCVATIGAVAESSKAAAFELADMHAGSMPFSKSAVEREMHAVDGNGTVHKGADAILLILNRYPRWRPIVWFARLPFIRPLLPYSYQFIARNRRFLSKLF